MVSRLTSGTRRVSKTTSTTALLKATFHLDLKCHQLTSLTIGHKPIALQLLIQAYLTCHHTALLLASAHCCPFALSLTMHMLVTLSTKQKTITITIIMISNNTNWSQRELSQLAFYYFNVWVTIFSFSTVTVNVFFWNNKKTTDILCGLVAK